MEASQSETNNSFLDLSNSLATAVERTSATVVAVDARPRVRSSGVLWRPGVVVSTNHTIKRDEEISIVMPDGKTLPATLAGRDASTDLAVLRLDGGNVETHRVAEIGDAAALRVGNLVLAVGRTDARGVSASFGVVSRVGGAWRTWRGGEIDRLLRLDLAIYLGFSGGPLTDTAGRILGINTSALARGAALTIPASTVNRVVDALLEKGHIARGYLGIGMHPVRLSEQQQQKLSLSVDSGLIVLSVEPNGPASKAGMLIGDVLYEMDGRRLRDTDDVQAVLGASAVGREITAFIIRGGANTELKIVVGERPRRGR